MLQGKREQNSKQCIGVMLLQKVKWISRHLQEITLWCACVCVCAWCIMSVSVSLCLSLWGPLMNRHALPIEVKVMAVISTRHGHHSVLWWEATSVYHCCQLHYLPVEPYLSLYTNVEHIWRRAMNLVYQPWLLLDCNQMLLDFHFLFSRLRNNHLFVAWQNATIVGNCKWHLSRINEEY